MPVHTITSRDQWDELVAKTHRSGERIVSVVPVHDANGTADWFDVFTVPASPMVIQLPGNVSLEEVQAIKEQWKAGGGGRAILATGGMTIVPGEEIR